MGLSNAHNLTDLNAYPRPYGVRVSLRQGDPFRKLLGPDWSRTHWYLSPSERDAALAEMARKHEYSRQPRPVMLRGSRQKLRPRNR
jgi:hypothetical protein